MAGKASLAEIMGSNASSRGEGLKLKHLSEILGEGMPELPRNQIGRHRLVRALQQRFGKNFRSLPGVGNLVKEFDREIETEKNIAKIQAIKPRRSRG